ncbi:carbon-monoxide dehydrogenase large subunit [Variovorax beijingensis]|uniref:Carbon-monoxide dehydrogenase large subunit n=1 Tax=Variovorax beijingensis TaxID=2496117 RepID=A0A561C5Z8_9BURK|nr:MULTISPECIES: xanthine dehydrogenase family protein molybdopterin-binding subunit [Variovorax]MBD9665763.1 xanthine dehydrogenase family protein molybdopterin-binding subunit [Variovorax sp. VRV01]MDP9967788.1 carbon-monoxide dehydrogenase large subunit [Variovorax paradoxus]MDR6453783.1 carbon-monoxide dehydrogenase large subunit [Variovorax paradoxus]TWD86467.1 carbon-monoxide dehydrogenase large subunit [Variovorax beijingensis]
MTTDSIPTRFGSGQAVRRLEDESLLSGAGRYTDDVALPGQTHLVFLRSPYPHARIVSIDTAAAAAMPGVLRVITGAELAEAGVKPMPGAVGFKRADGSDCASPPRLALAHGRARFVGEAVAAVVAETVQQARDAAEAVVVDYEALPMVVDLASATADSAPLLCDEATGNVAAEMRHGSSDAATAAFAKAKHVVALDVVNQRVVALTIEPRSVLAAPDAESGRLTIRMSTQMPSGVRDSICAAIGLAKEKVRVVVGDVGGGFGMKTGAYPEDIAVAFAALQVKRPVKWVADRSEEFLSSAHGRDIEAKAELALDADGKILALRIKTLANVGAYATGTGVAIQLLIGPWVQTSVYDIQTIDFHFKAVLTNTAPTGAYRGAGRPEAIFTIERLMDEAARQTGIDRVALRRRNFIRPEQMPYRNPMAQTYDTGKFESVMDQALALADWQGFEARAAESAKNGKHRGLGIATFLEWTGGNVFEERVTVSVQADGVIEVFSAVNAMGQGIATSLAQLAVDAFGVPIEKVRVVLGDTDRGDGFGSAGSRSLFTGGSAVRIGAERTIDKARTLAAQEFEAAIDDITYTRGVFTVAGTDLELDLFALAGKQPGREIFVDSTSTVAGPTWPNGCHVCEIEIDPPTGEISVVAYSSVNDVGRVINPMIVRGQLEGGAVQGIGQALYEQVVYDNETGQPLTGSLMDYAAPRADIVQAMFHMEMDESTPCANNPLGVKGVGELGTIGATPAIVNAVADAFARNGLAASAPHLHMPLSPARVWQAMHTVD